VSSIISDAYYDHFTGQRALTGTPSDELEDFAGAVLVPACPCTFGLGEDTRVSSLVLPAPSLYHLFSDA